MPISIPRSLVEYILLGPAGERRHLQDSPVLGDVWIAYAKDPDGPQELLMAANEAFKGTACWMCCGLFKTFEGGGNHDLQFGRPAGAKERLSSPAWLLMIEQVGDGSVTLLSPPVPRPQ